MKLIIYGGDDLRRIESRMGSDEYSYHFVIEAFRPVLARIGEVHTVAHLDEVEPIRAACERSGQSCVVLSFVPPHKTTLFMRVPLIPVFAWEYENIPYEVWDGQPKHDWRMVLQQQGRAITLSSHSAAVVRATMGESFPVVGIPPPVFDRMAALRERIGGRLPTAQTLDWAPVVHENNIMSMSLDNVVLPPSFRFPIVVHGPAVENKEVVPTVPNLLQRLVGIYREEIRPSMPRRVARAIAAAGGLTWHASHRARSLARPRISAIRRASAGRIAHGYRALHIRSLHTVVKIVVPSPGSAPQPVFPMPPPLDSLPIPLPLAQPTFIEPPSLAERGMGACSPTSTPQKMPKGCYRLDGIVYLAIVNPDSGRKNWEDLISAFTWAFRDVGDAVLVIKTVGIRSAEQRERCLASLRKQPAFACSILLVHGFLDDDQMGQLLEASSYVVNASRGEGCALPLLEGMAVGRPAIAPDHTAMNDYVDDKTAFVVSSHLEVTAFPHDGRSARRTMWHQLRWDSLRDAFCESYSVAKTNPDQWLLMARNSIDRQRFLSGDDVVARKLCNFLGTQTTLPRMPNGGSDLSCVPVDLTSRQRSMAL